MANLTKNILSTLAYASVAAVVSSTPATSHAAPPIYYESDLMTTSDQKSWVITNIIHTIVTNVPIEQIPRLHANPETKKSLAKVHEAYAATPDKVKVGYLSDLSYAYSYSNAPLYSHFGGWVSYAWKHINNMNDWAEYHSDAWRNSKAYTLGTSGAMVGVTYGAVKAGKWCLRKAATAAPAAAPAAPAIGLLASLWGKTKGAISLLTSVKVVGAAIVAQTSKACGDYYVAGPYALQHYTNMLTGDVTDTYSSTIADTVYGYSYMDAPDYYDGYLNSYLFYALMKSLLIFRNSDNIISFEDIDRIQKNQLWKVDNATSLKPPVEKNLQVCHMLDESYSGAELVKRQKSCKPQNKKLMSDIVKARGCAKYTFYNVKKAGRMPLTLVSICSDNSDTAFLKFPELGFANAPKTKVPEILYRISQYTGATKVTAQNLP